MGDRPIESASGVDFTWDEAGMMNSSIVSAGDTAGIEGTNEYGYDASQKRVFKKITRNGSVAEHTVYIYAGPNCIAEYSAGSAPSAADQEYVYAQTIDSLVMVSRSNGTQNLTVTRNQQWSVSALSDYSGTVLERYSYDLFGKRTVLAADGSTIRTSSSYDNPYGYTSRRHDDESGLMYFRARYYDSNSGEFASRDPLEYVDGMSLMRGYFVPGKVDFRGEHIADPNSPDCFDQCVKDGGSHGFCSELCNTDLENTSQPDKPNYWGHELGNETFFPPPSEADDGSCGCKCVTGSFGGGNIQRPRGTIPQAPLPTAGDTDVPCKKGQKRTMRYQGICNGENCSGTCFEYRLWRCDEITKRKRVKGELVVTKKLRWTNLKQLFTSCGI